MFLQKWDWAILVAATVFCSRHVLAQTPELPSPVQESGATKAAPSAVLVGEGKTLPARVVRGRLVYKYAHGSKAFAADGKKEESGFTLSAGAAAFVAEYGWKESVSIQLVAPYVVSNRLAIDGEVFQKSSFFAKKYNEFIEAAAAKLVGDGLCLTIAACVSGINDKGLSLPFNSDLVLPTGEKLSVKAGVPIKTIASSLVTRAAIPTSGSTGAGDVELGALVAIADPGVGIWARDWPVNFSLGAGLRFPTGSFSSVSAAQRPTGRGTLDLGIRTNLDWNATPGLMLSWQNQWETVLRPGKKARSSLLDSSKLNTADVNTAGADGISNSSEFTRDDARQIGFLKAAWAAGNVSDHLSRVLLNGQIKYDFEPKVTLGGQEFSPESNLIALQTGLTLSAMDFALPMQWDVDYEIPMSGKNRTLAASVVSSTFKIYARF
ncbi:MAG: hypothetical protein RI953_433 [Pseudomonadota bacterium]